MDDKGTDMVTYLNRLLEDDNFPQIEHYILEVLKTGIEWQIQTNYAIYDQKMDNFCFDEKTKVIEPIDYDDLTYSKNIPNFLSCLVLMKVDGKLVLASPIIRVTELFMVYYEIFKGLLPSKIEEAYGNIRMVIETYKETNKEFYLYGIQAMELLAIHIMTLNDADKCPYLTLETWTRINTAVKNNEIILQENLGPYIYD